MSHQKVAAWDKAKTAVQRAKAWQNLPNGPRYENDTFAISLAHCKPPTIVRAGQRVCGGQNYWETEQEFNLAILEYIVKDWKEVYLKVMAIMEKKEKDALIDLQSYVDSMQNMINEAKEK